ncbi:MAG: hypothetical protein AAF517_15230, partial [Planctomycetota bacterium]
MRIVRPSGRRVGGASSFAALFPQLFLIPLLLVTIGVLVYLFFIAVAEDARSIEKILSDMESGGKHSRGQDAYALSQRLNEEALKNPGKRRFLTKRQADLLISLLEKQPDELTRKYVPLVLGRAGQPATVVPFFRARLAKPDLSAEERSSLVFAMGATNSPDVVPDLVATVEKYSGPTDWELRLLTIHSLVQIAAANESHASRAKILELLQKTLKDEHRLVSWNTAYYLAEYFGDSSGVGVLRELLAPGFVDRLRNDHQR